MRGGALLALALVSGALVGAAPTQRILAPDGFGPVRVGMTQVQAERAIGVRLKVAYPDEDNTSCGEATRTDGRDRSVSYMIESGRVSRISTEDRAIRTARGVGVGSTIAQVRRAYGKALRSHPNPYSDQPDLEIKGPHGFGLIFETDGHRVLTMRGGRYPAVGYIESCL